MSSIVSILHGRNWPQVRAGNCFIAANPGTQALSVNSATATGLILSNPASSEVVLSLLQVCVSIASLPAGQSSIILTGAFSRTQTATTHTTPLTVRNCLLGAALSSGTGLADSAATIPTPAVVRVLGGGPAATVATSTSFPAFIKDDIDDLLTLMPGTCISLQALTTAITVVASMVWEEIPLSTVRA